MNLDCSTKSLVIKLIQSKTFKTICILITAFVSESILDSYNIKQSLTCLENKMKERTWREKEFWLIDISAFQNIDNASLMLNTLSLDFNEDIFLYMFIKNDTASIWEMYKLAPEKDVIIRDFGSWTKEIGLKFTKLEKWQRRGDLYVRI